MADPKVELGEVKEELAHIEQQIQMLLERQGALHDKKQQLEVAIREAATAAPTDNTDWERTDFAWSSSVDEARGSVFTVPIFRPLQLSTINATMAGRDCILIMPTGGGKSLCFQLPAVVSKGITLVVSPLVSLMEDQLMGLHRLRVNASLLNASSSREEVNSVHAAMTDKKSPLKLLYVTPEKLAKSKRFMNKLEKMYEGGRFVRLVIDEVHCCSQWGHDFRPDYKFLGVMRRQFPGVPILGLTATATSTVVTDTKKILGISACVTFRSSFNRHNLFYEVRTKPASQKAIMDDIQDLINSRFKGQSGIIYCVTRKDTEEVTRELNIRGLAAGCYHGDMDARQRSDVHRQWMTNNAGTKVVVATIAFGMGIDKANVRFVIHHGMSKSMENYYQESGRAGRDDAVAHCILYINFGDVFRQSTMVFTEQTGLEKLYAMVAYSYDLSSCRRMLIAKHFGECWDSANCNKMCDHCDAKLGGAVVKKDIGAFCCDVLRILEHAQATKQRVTPLKLLDAWQGKGATSLRERSVRPPRLSRFDCERIVAYMLLHSYLREDFHFTPYSTISYLLPGSRASLLTSGGGREVLLDMASDSSMTNQSATSSTSSAARGKRQPNNNNTGKPPKDKVSRKRKPASVASEREGGPSFEAKKTRVTQRLKETKKAQIDNCIILDESDDECDTGGTAERMMTLGHRTNKTPNSLNSSGRKSDKTSGQAPKQQPKVKVVSNGRVKGLKSHDGQSDFEELCDVYEEQLGSVDRGSPVPGRSLSRLADSFESSGSGQNMDRSVCRESFPMSEDEDGEYDDLQTMYAQQLSMLESNS